jgi:sugar phosphate isomerase/epimerase
VLTDGITFSVFTKPWKTLPLPRLGEFVRRLGFDGIELPVRPGFQIEPQNAAALGRTARQLGELGVKICSIAGPADEATIAACAEAEIPVIRVGAPIRQHEGYVQAETRLRRELDALVPIVDRYGIKLGIQNHCDRYVSNAVGLRALVQGYDPRHVSAIWDAAHEALGGGRPDFALDIIWSHLCMVNLKNALWRRTNGPEAESAEWTVDWVGGRQGLASWPQVVQELKARSFSGTVCLTAEYSDHRTVDRMIGEDLAFARSLFA